MRMRVHIERLVVDPGAMRADEVPAFEAAFRHEMGRLLAKVTPTASPTDVAALSGRDAARAIHRKLS